MAVREVLEELGEVRGVEACALVGEDGFVIEGIQREGVPEVDFLGGAATSAMASARALADHLQRGAVEEVMVEYPEGPVLLVPLEVGESSYMLVTLLDSVQSLGRVRFQLKRVVPRLREVLV